MSVEATLNEPGPAVPAVPAPADLGVPAYAGRSAFPPGHTAAYGRSLMCSVQSAGARLAADVANLPGGTFVNLERGL